MAQPREVVAKFVEQINRQNAESLSRLMTEDHRFIDALGVIVQGKEKVRQAWTGYFRIVPDYHISIDEVFARHGVVVALGKASGTFSRTGELMEGNRWQV